MAWTTPRTWVSGEVVTATIMNTHIRDNFAAITDSVKAKRTTSYNTRNTDIPLNAADDWDDWNGHDPSTNSERITLPAAGRYRITWWANPTGGSDGGWEAWARRYNSSNVLQEDNLGGNGSGYTDSAGGSCLISASANDYITMRYDAGAAGTHNSLANLYVVVERVLA